MASSGQDLEGRITNLFEALLATVPDNAVIKAATKALNRELKRPASMVVMLKLMQTHAQPGVCCRYSLLAQARRRCAAGKRALLCDRLSNERQTLLHALFLAQLSCILHFLDRFDSFMIFIARQLP